MKIDCSLTVEALELLNFWNEIGGFLSRFVREWMCAVNIYLLERFTLREDNWKKTYMLSMSSESLILGKSNWKKTSKLFQVKSALFSPFVSALATELPMFRKKRNYFNLFNNFTHNHFPKHSTKSTKMHVIMQSYFVLIPHFLPHNSMISSIVL